MQRLCAVTGYNMFQGCSRLCITHLQCACTLFTWDNSVRQVYCIMASSFLRTPLPCFLYLVLHTSAHEMQKYIPLFKIDLPKAAVILLFFTLLKFTITLNVCVFLVHRNSARVLSMCCPLFAPIIQSLFACFHMTNLQSLTHYRC